MEQRLDATYLQPGLIHRAAAVGFCAISIGVGIFLATWGISFLWHPAEDPRIDALVSHLETLKEKVANGFDALGQKLGGLDAMTVKLDSLSQSVAGLDHHVGTLELKTASPLTGPGGSGKTPDGDIIKTMVTVFSEVDHEGGRVTTGWRYNDGASANGKPILQYCYYEVANLDGARTRIDMAYDRKGLNFYHVPQPEEALRKCRWWTGS
jgi:hypothetical protein